MPTVRPHPIQLGLTGGIGSGKSTVARMFADAGAAVIDADAISRQSTAPGGAAIEPIRQAFGKHFIGADGALDRARMRELCFADPAQRKRLEAIIHPIVQQQGSRQVADHAAAGTRLIIRDIPLLVESEHWRQQLDRVLVIDCSPETQVRRVIERGHPSGQPPSREEVLAILKAQATRQQRLACADFVIHNENLSLEDLRAEVANVVELLGCALDPGQTGLSSEL